MLIFVAIQNRVVGIQKNNSRTVYVLTSAGFLRIHLINLSLSLGERAVSKVFFMKIELGEVKRNVGTLHSGASSLVQKTARRSKADSKVPIVVILELLLSKAC